jgi:rhomboid protease GluP
LLAAEFERYAASMMGNFVMTSNFKQIMWEGISCRRVAWVSVTWTLVAVNFLSWFIVAWLYDLPLLTVHNSYVLLRAGAASGELLWAGEWWRIITSQFLHVYFLHLIFNMAALSILGAALESELGSLRFALLYLFIGTSGQVIGAVVAPSHITSGSSQAVMGIAGVMAINLLRRRKSETFMLITLLAVISIQLGLDLAVAHTIKTGHWTSLCLGAVAGYTLRLSERDVISNDAKAR